MNAFECSLEVGQVGESLIANWIKRRAGVAILPVYELEKHTGKGPRIFMGEGDLVAPDMLVMRPGKPFYWCEAKHKSVFTWYRKTNTWQTGIDLHHYRQYCEVRKQFGLDVWLLFLHRSAEPDEKDRQYDSCPATCPTGLFGREIEALIRCEDHRDMRWGRYGMVYWAEASLKRIATLEEVKGE